MGRRNVTSTPTLRRSSASYIPASSYVPAQAPRSDPGRWPRLGNRDLSAAEETVVLLKGEGFAASALQCDVTNEEDVAGAVEVALQRLRRSLDKVANLQARSGKVY